MGNSQGRKGFFFYKSWLEQIEMLDNDRDKLMLFEMIAEFGIYGKIKERKVSQMIKMAWLSIEPNLRANWGKYLNGITPKKTKSKGAPKGNKNAQKKDEDEHLPF